MHPFRIFLHVAALALVTVSSRAGVRTDLEYGQAGGESLRLDASIPDGPGPFAAVILVHGGGWTAGDKSGGPRKGYMAPMHGALEHAGFAWFSINYRLAPKHRYPACLDDVLAAVRWVHAHAKEYHLDPARIALAGESAGGHLVALAAMRAEPGLRLAAVVPFYGRFDLIDDLAAGAELRSNYVALFGQKTLTAAAREQMHAASPLFFVRRGLPPFLLVHGTADQTVPYEQSVLLQARLRENGVPCEFISVPGGAHGMLGWEKFLPNYREQVVAWLEKTFRASVAAR